MPYSDWGSEYYVEMPYDYYDNYVEMPYSEYDNSEDPLNFLNESLLYVEMPYSGYDNYVEMPYDYYDNYVEMPYSEPILDNLFDPNNYWGSGYDNYVEMPYSEPDFSPFNSTGYGDYSYQGPNTIANNPLLEDNYQWMLDTIANNPDLQDSAGGGWGDGSEDPLNFLNESLLEDEGGFWNTLGKILGGGNTGSTVGTLGKIGGDLFSAWKQSSAAKNASEAQVQSAEKALGLLEKMYNQQRADQAPWLQAGKTGLNALLYGMGLGGTEAGGLQSGELMRPFGMGDFEADPGYQFRVSEGEKALERTAAAKGSALSGGAVKAALRYNSGLASQEYANAFDRYNINQANKYNRLAGLSGTGQVAVNQLGGAAQNYGNAGGDMFTQMGNARASGYVGSGNAWSNAIGNVGNTIMETVLLNKLLGGGY